jgi:hypothetical protein
MVVDYFNKLRSIGFTVIEEDYTNKITPELVGNNYEIKVKLFCLF